MGGVWLGGWERNGRPASPQPRKTRQRRPRPCSPHDEELHVTGIPVRQLHGPVARLDGRFPLTGLQHQRDQLPSMRRDQVGPLGSGRGRGRPGEEDQGRVQGVGRHGSAPGSRWQGRPGLKMLCPAAAPSPHPKGPRPKPRAPTHTASRWKTAAPSECKPRGNAGCCGKQSKGDWEGHRQHGSMPAHQHSAAGAVRARSGSLHACSYPTSAGALTETVKGLVLGEPAINAYGLRESLPAQCSSTHAGSWAARGCQQIFERDRVGDLGPNSPITPSAARGPFPDLTGMACMSPVLKGVGRE